MGVEVEVGRGGMLEIAAFGVILTHEEDDWKRSLIRTHDEDEVTEYDSGWTRWGRVSSRPSHQSTSQGFPLFVLPTGQHCVAGVAYTFLWFVISLLFSSPPLRQSVRYTMSLMFSRMTILVVNRSASRPALLVITTSFLHSVFEPSVGKQTMHQTQSNHGCFEFRSDLLCNTVCVQSAHGDEILKVSPHSAYSHH